MRDTILDIRVLESETTETTLAATASAMLVTGCCGARMYVATAMPICPCCDRPIVSVKVEQERELTHLRHTATRYWS